MTTTSVNGARDSAKRVLGDHDSSRRAMQVDVPGPQADRAYARRPLRRSPYRRFIRECIEEAMRERDNNTDGQSIARLRSLIEKLRAKRLRVIQNFEDGDIDRDQRAGREDRCSRKFGRPSMLCSKRLRRTSTSSPRTLHPNSHLSPSSNLSTRNTNGGFSAFSIPRSASRTMN